MTVRGSAKNIAMIAALAACGGESPTSPPPSQPTTPTTPTTPTQPTTPTPPNNPTPPTPSGGYSAVLSTSSASPNVGDRVTVWVRVTRTNAADPKVGSFAGQVTYDSTSLKWDAQQNTTTGDALVAANSPVASLVKVAGATTSGFPNDTVAAFSMVVLKAGGVGTLKILMNELSTTAFESKVSTP